MRVTLVTLRCHSFRGSVTAFPQVKTAGYALSVTLVTLDSAYAHTRESCSV